MADIHIRLDGRPINAKIPRIAPTTNSVPDTAKTTPVDADVVTIWDSAASWVRKKLSWANVKATLKTYFDSLYATLGANSNITSLSGLTTPLSVAQGGTGAATAAAALAALGGQAAVTVSALPTGDSIVTNQIVHLTQADDTAKAGIGYYVHDETGWLCLLCIVPYAWGSMGATPALALIAGCDYIFTASEEWTAVITMSRPGVCNWTKSGEFTANAPTATGRTVKTRTADGWTDAGAALVEGCFRDDGTYMVISAVELA